MGVTAWHSDDVAVSKRYQRYSASVIQSKRWPSLRHQAKRRDNFCCVKCGAVGRLEVDHILSVRTRPDLAFELSNLQTLCARCHTSKTRIECGHPQLSPERQQWRDLLKGKSHASVSHDQSPSI